ncbi:ATP-binding protein [uncultured Amaricoccus sp.]|uniref:hybrid sensor histidine kinase/response regulator n=1 Tax=uncultured Amaricoccus sp. TaxID=339341 RepID=UPI0026253A88|nr:ATP-binding protein [uncultured Amaricoccus sp.]
MAIPETGQAAHRQASMISTFATMFLAVAVILGAGIFADLGTRDAARRNHRAETLSRLDTHAVAIGGALRAETRDLRELGFAFVGPTAAGDLATEDFAAVAKPLVDGPNAVRGVAVTRAGGSSFVHPDTPEMAALLRVPDDAPRDRAGTRMAEVGGRRMLVLWLPLREPLAEGATRVLGLAAGAVDFTALLADAGLPSLQLDLAITGVAGEPGDQAIPVSRTGRNVLAADPVTVPLTLLDQNWTLAAVPAAGWTSGGAVVWPIWLLTLVATLLNVGLVLRARHLNDERQRNIDALRDRETQLDRLSRRLGLALDASKVGVWDYHIDKGTLVWDDRMDELYALPADGRTRTYHDWSGALHPDDLARAEAEFDEAINVTGRYNSDYRLLLPDRTVRHIRAIGAVYREADGTSKIVGVNWDVTADVRRSSELEAKRREAEAASVAKSQFLATMSHEIRTPMNGVIGMLDLLLRTDLDPTQLDRARVASTSARQLLSLLNDVLDFSKLEANRVTLDRTDTDVAALARDVVALMSATAEERQIRLNVRVAPRVPRYLVCDPMRLRQVLINLVGNAVKFTEVGSVEVELDHVAGETPSLEVAVRDSGVGITEEAKANLFQRFAQVDSSSTRQRGGTGLGLAISKQLVELMGGEISVQSTPGLGSTFRFGIPAEIGAAPPEASDKPATGLCAETAGARPSRILVAEDNATNQQVLAAYLALEGHVAHIVGGGAEAVAEAQSGVFDLVLMDIQMPGMDGITAARRIRALDGPVSRIPIIALTANAMAGDKETYFAAGMTDYVAKPVSAAELSAAIARVIAPSQFTPPPRPVPGGAKLSLAVGGRRMGAPRSPS